MSNQSPLDRVITKQVLSTPPDKLTYNDIKWLDLDYSIKKEYELRWRISLPALREVTKMPKSNPIKKWYIGLDAFDKTKAFISEIHPSKKDYPQFVKVIGPFNEYGEVLDYIKGDSKKSREGWIVVGEDIENKDDAINVAKIWINKGFEADLDLDNGTWTVYVKKEQTHENPRHSSRAHFCKERVQDPRKFDSRSFRTVTARAHRVTVGCPTGQWDAKNGVCRVPMEVQRILHPEGEAKCPVPGKELRKNPGAHWHREQAKVWLEMSRLAPERPVEGRPRAFYVGASHAHKSSAEQSKRLGINPPAGTDADIEFTAVELYTQGHGVDDIRFLIQKEFGVSRQNAEYWAKRAGRIVRGDVRIMESKTALYLESLKRMSE